MERRKTKNGNELFEIGEKVWFTNEENDVITGVVCGYIERTKNVISFEIDECYNTTKKEPCKNTLWEVVEGNLYREK